MRTPGNSSTSSFLLCSLFGDTLGLPHGAYLDFPRPRERRAADGRYRESFATCATFPQDIVFRLSIRMIHILPHAPRIFGGP